MKKRTLLGQILTVVIYLYNIAAIGLFTVMIAGLIGSNSIADKYGDTIDRVTGISSVGAVFTFISIGIVWIVFYFILKKIRDAAGFIDKESISNKKDDKGSLIEYFSKRKKNTVLFIILGLFNKVLIHFLFYPYQSRSLLKKATREGIGRRAVETSPAEYSDYYNLSFGEHLNAIFKDELILFIPAFLSLGLIVWYFNDKIKAK
jgi:hypothetical protein